jgi:uncharacterized protein (TIGR00251 family)
VAVDVLKNLHLEIGQGWIQIQVRVLPRSSVDEIAGVMAGCLKIRLAAPPVEGKANRALQSFLSKRLDIPKGDVEIVSGHASRIKRVRFRGIAPADLFSCIPEILESEDDPDG